MKKARILLTAIAAFALIGAAFAFNVSKFNLTPVYKTTLAVTTAINGSTYTFNAPIGNPFCTTTLRGHFVQPASLPGATYTYYTTAGAISSTTTVAGTTVVLFRSCPTITGWVTTIP